MRNDYLATRGWKMLNGEQIENGPGTVKESLEQNGFGAIAEMAELLPAGPPTSDTVMVACPVYSGKDYAMQAYVQAYNAFLWPYRSLYMVDDTPLGPFYYEHLLSMNIPCEHVDPTDDFRTMMIRSWKHIWKEAVRQGVKWVASIETDTICPPLTLDTLLNVAHYCKAVHVAHGYRWHKSQAKQGQLIGLGCNLILTDLLTKIYEQEQWYTDSFECELYEYPKLHNLPAVEVYSLLDIVHLDPKDGEEYYHFRSEPLPKLTYGNVEERLPIQYKKLAPMGTGSVSLPGMNGGRVEGSIDC